MLLELRFFPRSRRARARTDMCQSFARHKVVKNEYNTKQMSIAEATMSNRRTAPCRANVCMHAHRRWYIIASSLAAESRRSAGSSRGFEDTTVMAAHLTRCAVVLEGTRVHCIICRQSDIARDGMDVAGGWHRGETKGTL